MTTKTDVQATGLKPMQADEYWRHHAESWPEVIATAVRRGSS